MKFPNKLRKLIEKKGITQKFLAEELNIPASTLGGYVQGTSEPDFETLQLIADYFNVSPEYFFTSINSGANFKAKGEKELIRIYRSLTPEQQEIYLEQGRAFVKYNSKAFDE